MDFGVEEEVAVVVLLELELVVEEEEEHIVVEVVEEAVVELDNYSCFADVVAAVAEESAVVAAAVEDEFARFVSADETASPLSIARLADDSFAGAATPALVSAF